ncbi:MAG: hypothetical protein U0V87_04505 [Acidobacteriota bacterium]
MSAFRSVVSVLLGSLIFMALAFSLHFMVVQLTPKDWWFSELPQAPATSQPGAAPTETWAMLALATFVTLPAGFTAGMLTGRMGGHPHRIHGAGLCVVLGMVLLTTLVVRPPTDLYGWIAFLGRMVLLVGGVMGGASVARRMEMR